jgi:hypothetical protein
MAAAKRRQSGFRSSLPILVMPPANGAGIADGGDAVNWLWLNIPLMAAFFIATTGIPLWLVFKHPDQGRQSAPRPRATASRQPTAAHARPVPAYLPSNRDRYAQVGR